MEKATCLDIGKDEPAIGHKVRNKEYKSVVMAITFCKTRQNRRFKNKKGKFVRCFPKAQQDAYFKKASLSIISVDNSINF